MRFPSRFIRLETWSFWGHSLQVQPLRNSSLLLMFQLPLLLRSLTPRFVTAHRQITLITTLEETDLTLGMPLQLCSFAHQSGACPLSRIRGRRSSLSSTLRLSSISHLSSVESSFQLSRWLTLEIRRATSLPSNYCFHAPLNTTCKAVLKEDANFLEWHGLAAYLPSHVRIRIASPSQSASRGASRVPSGQRGAMA